MAGGIAASITSELPVVARSATVMKQPMLIIGYQSPGSPGSPGLASSTKDESLTRTNMANLDLLAERATGLAEFMEKFAATYTQNNLDGIINGQEADVMDGWDRQMDVLNQLWDSVRAELDKQGLSGMFGHWIPGGEDANPFFESLIDATRQNSDPMQAILDQLAFNPLGDLTAGGLTVGGLDLQMARDALSVPGLEAFQGPDVLSMTLRDLNSWSSDGPAAPPATGAAAPGPREPSPPIATYYDKNGVKVVELANGYRQVQVSEGLSKGTLKFNTHTAIPIYDKDGNIVLTVAIPEAGNKDKNEIIVKAPADKGGTRIIMDPKTGKTGTTWLMPDVKVPALNRYELPDGPVFPQGPIQFDPQTKLDQLTQPGIEGDVDYGAMIDRLARGLVAHLMSKVNPNPNGPVVEGGDKGGSQVDGIVGGDRHDDTPVIHVTRGKGPKPIGNPDSPTGPGGPLPKGMVATSTVGTAMVATTSSQLVAGQVESGVTSRP